MESSRDANPRPSKCVRVRQDCLHCLGKSSYYEHILDCSKADDSETEIPSENNDALPTLSASSVSSIPAEGNAIYYNHKNTRNEVCIQCIYISLRFTFGFICHNSIGNKEIISDDEISDETPNFEISEFDQDQDVDLLTEDGI